MTLRHTDDRGWRVLVVAGMLAAAISSAYAAGPAETLLKQEVTIEFRGGDKLVGIRILDAAIGDVPATIRTIEFKHPEKDRFFILGHGEIIKVSGDRKNSEWVYYAPADALVESGRLARDQKRIDQQVERLAAKRAAALRKGAGKPASAAEKSNGESSAGSPIAAGRELAWPPTTEATQQRAMAEHEQLIGRVQQAFSDERLTVFETNFFLFCTSLPPELFRPFAVKLDAMYQELCLAFGLDPVKNIWHGKAVVFMFTQRSRFDRFEQEFMRAPAPSDEVQALCHSFSNGPVVVAGAVGSDPAYFAIVLVHETVHGFIHRFQTRVDVPSWLNEGAAEWIAAYVTKDREHIPRKIKRARDILRQQGSLGGDFFGDSNIQAWQYGVASDMTDFLLRTNPEQYRRLIEGIKRGLPWQKSLEDAYGWSVAELVDRYGQFALGTAGLRP